MSYIIPYNPKLKKTSKELRNKSTKAEVLLWKYLKRKQILGITFYRQRPLGNYIVDFYSSNLKLAIEIDGESHELKDNYDEKRQEDLYRLGINILRFNNEQVKKDINGTILVIKKWIIENKIPRPGFAEGTPLTKRGEI